MAHTPLPEGFGTLIREVEPSSGTKGSSDSEVAAAGFQRLTAHADARDTDAERATRVLRVSASCRAASHLRMVLSRRSGQKKVWHPRGRNDRRPLKLNTSTRRSTSACRRAQSYFHFATKFPASGITLGAAVCASMGAGAGISMICNPYVSGGVGRGIMTVPFHLRTRAPRSR